MNPKEKPPALTKTALMALAHEQLQEAIRETQNSTARVESVIQQLSSEKRSHRTSKPHQKKGS